MRRNLLNGQPALTHRLDRQTTRYICWRCRSFGRSGGAQHTDCVLTPAARAAISPWCDTMGRNIIQLMLLLGETIYLLKTPRTDAGWAKTMLITNMWMFFYLLVGIALSRLGCRAHHCHSLPRCSRLRERNRYPVGLLIRGCM